MSAKRTDKTKKKEQKQKTKQSRLLGIDLILRLCLFDVARTGNLQQSYFCETELKRTEFFFLL